jgi:folate-binding protein YgfZ
VEAGRPAWGAELDGSVIPLEANLADAISFDKGCYLGQEIIARIHSRGHTNRSLIGLRSDIEMCSGDRLLALNGDREGQDVGWITSSANSPRYGWIGLGYLRNDCLQDGAMFAGANGARIASAMLPIHFTSGA